MVVKKIINCILSSRSTFKKMKNKLYYIFIVTQYSGIFINVQFNKIIIFIVSLMSGI